MSFGAMTWKVYIAPLVAPNIFGNYQEVTEYVEAKSLSNLTIKTEQTDFTVGVAQNSSITVKLKNDSGLFSDEQSSETIFTYKRAGSKLKITYFEGIEIAAYGSALYADSVYGNEVSIFEGVISTESVRQDVQTDMVSLSALGIESIFEQVEFSQSDVNTSESVRFLFENILDKPEITSLVVVDIANFTVGVDFILDNTNDFEDTDTVKEALDKLLRVSNSILYIQDGTIYISDKEPSIEVLFSFYGQASNLGIENIQNIKNFTDGLPRTFNLWRWDPDEVEDGFTPASPVKSQSSVDKFGVRKELVGIKGINDVPTQTLVLNSYLTEYGDRKQEMQLTTPANYDVIRLSLLSKVDIDYPTPLFPADGGDLPIWGTPTMTWREFRWPYSQFEFFIPQTTKWKIIGIQYSINKDLVTFNIREI